MKKIIIILIPLLLVGCAENNEVSKVKKIFNLKEEKVEKEYYVSTVPYISHDDLISINYVSKEPIIDEPSYQEEVPEDAVASVIEGEPVSDVKEVIEDELVVSEVQQEESINNIELNSKQDVLAVENNIVQEEEPVKELGYYGPSGKYLGISNVKVIDVSYYQGIIDWDKFVNESDCYGVIIRIGFYNTLDKMFERNLNEVKRLNIPYGIYLFSYAGDYIGAQTEANFTNNIIDLYDLKPTLGIYYDIESWTASTCSSDNITKDEYDGIISTYVSMVSGHVNNSYKVSLYSGRWYAMNRLSTSSKRYVSWVAEYNDTCKYDSDYTMWQYTSKGMVPGINGNVDISYLK